MILKVIIAEDHQALIDGVVSFFELNDKINIIGTANDGEELLELLENHQPHVIISDIRMPRMDGIQATKIIKKKYPKINILAFTMFDGTETINKMLDAGAIGYILKNSGLKIMLEAINSVARGKAYFDPNVLVNLQEVKNTSKKPSKQKKGILSNREKQIYDLIGNGKTSIEISEELCISKLTVDTHRKKMARKLGLKHGQDLKNYIFENKYDM